MILPSEKATKGLRGSRREFPAAASEGALQPPLIDLEYLDNHAQPPSYSDSFATSAGTSLTSSTGTTETVVVVPTISGSPASSFTRVPSMDVLYPSFQPLFLVATGKTLDKGFPNASPPSKSNPHPFVSHDINEGDWIRYVFC